MIPGCDNSGSKIEPMTRKSKATKRPMVPLPKLDAFPGHGIRRLQQAAVASFMRDVVSSVVTPVQFAVLYKLAELPNIDQRTLAQAVGIDASTIGGVIDRLEARGWLVRNLSREDRRVRRVELTDAGAKLLREITPSVLEVQSRILEPLSNAQREQFLQLMDVLLAHHEACYAALTGR